MIVDLDLVKDMIKANEVMKGKTESIEELKKAVDLIEKVAKVLEE